MAEELPQTDSFGKERDLKFPRLASNARLVPIGLFFAGLFLLSVGVGLFVFKGNKSGDDIQIVSLESTPSSEIVIHVDGAVKKPGVYKLNSQARVSDAVSSAGGLTDDADTKRINLAAKLSDGQKLYIGKIGESGSQNVGGSANQIAGVSEGQININTASQKDLESLPGIGPVSAGKIIASRPYSAVEELLSRKVVGKSVYEKIKDLVTVY